MAAEPSSGSSTNSQKIQHLVTPLIRSLVLNLILFLEQELNSIFSSWKLLCWCLSNHKTSKIITDVTLEVIRSNHLLQYSTHEFIVFADSYSFIHSRSSPHNPQSSGQVKRMGQTAKKYNQLIHLSVSLLKY